MHEHRASHEDYRCPCRAGMTVQASVEATTSNGSAALASDVLDEALLLSVLADVRRGDFTARMPVAGPASRARWPTRSTTSSPPTRRSARSLRASVGSSGGGQAVRTRRFAGLGHEWSQSVDSVNSLIDDLVRPDQRDAARDRRRGRRRPEQEGHGRRPRRDARAQEHHQRDGRPAQRVHLRGDPRRRARSAPRASSARPRPSRSRSAASGRT